MVYAGAAPGTHVNFMAAALFPKLRFVLVDPAPFHAFRTSRVTVRRQLFTDDVAREFAGRTDVIFISDVRTQTG